VLTWAFTLFNTLRAVAYLPTMWAIYTSGDSSQHSLWTWCTWLGANATMGAWLYEQNGQRLGRAVVVKRLKPIMVEAVARGYLIGSGWKDYQQSGAVCGIALPAGLKQAGKLPQPIFTPAAKAEVGLHDENVDFDHVIKEVGREMAERIREVTLRLYSEAATFAATKGIMIADTKFEFGLDAHGTLHLMDEVLTPDSSRFWPADGYKEGMSPPSFDKQFVRDWLETQDWGKTPPAPRLPADVIAKTAAKYREALDRLTA
jgi:phosphoribosylaminoimidazole-succinocarboxamide synthase